MNHRFAAIAFSIVLPVSPDPIEPVTVIDVGPSGPYPLASVAFEYTEGGPRGSVTTTVRGDGTGTRASSGDLGRQESQAIAVEPKKVFELLELCYRKRFFELRTLSYGPPNWPRLQPDGTVDVMATVIADGGWRSIKLTIGNYSKTAGYSDFRGDAPPVLVELARRISELPIRTVPQ